MPTASTADRRTAGRRACEEAVAEPEVVLPAEATAVEMDGEWFVSWEPTVAGGGTAELTYEVPADTTTEMSIDGVADEKLTVEA